MGTSSQSPDDGVAMIHPSRRMLVKPSQPTTSTRRSPTPKRRSPSPKRSPKKQENSPRRQPKSKAKPHSRSRSRSTSRSRSRSASPNNKAVRKDHRKSQSRSRSRSRSHSRDSAPNTNASSTYRNKRNSRSRSRSRGRVASNKRDGRRSRSPIRGRTDTQTTANGRGRYGANASNSDRRAGTDNRGFRGTERGGRFNGGRVNGNVRDNRDRRVSGNVGNNRPTAKDTAVVAKLKDLPEIDREKTCPLLLRLFCCVGEHHNLKEYAGGKVPADELMVHTWLNATFKELTMLIKGAIDEAKPKGTRMVFSAVYPTPSGQMVMKEIGELTTGRKGERDLAALGQTRFKIGDYLDVAIHPPAVRGRGGGSVYGRY